jgi:hypothetical protein
MRLATLQLIHVAIQCGPIQSMEQFKELWKIIRVECNLN